MLIQYQFKLVPNKACDPRSEWAYCLYAMLLEHTESTFANSLHHNGRTPISQNLVKEPDGLRWTVTLMGTQAIAALDDFLAEQTSYSLQREHIDFKVMARQREEIEAADVLFERADRTGALHRLAFVTPTAFKSRGEYRILPSTHLIVQSLVNQWNCCFQDCPIEDEDGQGVEAIADQLICKQLRLCHQSYALKKQMIPGFMGTLVLQNRLHGFHKELANVLLDFASYSGIGIKTTLGMGGVTHKLL